MPAIALVDLQEVHNLTAHHCAALWDAAEKERKEKEKKEKENIPSTSGGGRRRGTGGAAAAEAVSTQHKRCVSPSLRSWALPLEFVVRCGVSALFDAALTYASEGAVVAQVAPFEACRWQST